MRDKSLGIARANRRKTISLVVVVIQTRPGYRRVAVRLNHVTLAVGDSPEGLARLLAADPQALLVAEAGAMAFWRAAGYGPQQNRARFVRQPDR